MLQILVSNNIRIQGASTPLKAAILRALTFDNPAYIERKKRRRPLWGIEKKILLYVYDMGHIVTPRGFKEELYELLKQHGIPAEKVVTYRQTVVDYVDFGPWDTDYEARSYQEAAIDASARAKRNGVIIAPAGAGKTLIGMKYIQELYQPALWITHTKDLMEQSIAAAYKYLKGVGEIGQLGDGKRNWGTGKLIVATVQTLQASPQLAETLKPLIGTVVIDEAHHFPAASFIDVAGQFPAANMIGLTATPDRKDNMEVYMYNGIGPKLYHIDREKLYAAGYLIKPDVKFIYTAFDYEQASEVSKFGAVDAGGEDLDFTHLKNVLIHDKDRLELVAENILENAWNNYSLVITESVRYCYMLRDKVEELADKKGYLVHPSHAVIHGPIQRYTWRKAKNAAQAEDMVRNGEAKSWRKHKTHGNQVEVEQYTAEEYEAWNISGRERKDRIAAAREKKIDILFATQLAREGLDMPHLNIGHMVMPKRGDSAGTNSGAAVEQELGRIMRADPDRPAKLATWYDYVDYEVGVLQDQYYSRRKVYQRLGIKLARKPKTEQQQIEDFLDGGDIFDLPY